jgi:hypothetical protein
MSYRERILAEIKRLGEKLGRAPSVAEFHRECRISWHQLRKHFGGMRAAVRAAGLEPGTKGCWMEEEVLVLDWARVVRELGRLPTQAKYDERGKHAPGTLHARIRWRELGHRFVLLVRELHLESEWADVLEIVWKQYPWLKHLAASNWEKMRPWGDRETGRSGDRAIGNTEERGREPLIIGRAEAQPRAAVPHEYGQGMRLGRVIAAALAIEILIAAERSIQQSALSNQQEQSNWQLANSNWQNQNQNQTQNLEPQRTPRNAEAEGQLVMEAQGQLEQCAEYHGTQTRVPPPQQMQSAHLPVPQRQAGIGALYGEPLGLAAMAHAPTNEDGVLFLFGVVAADLGFRIERVQRGFPDVEAKREVAPGVWELQLWELEWLSRNFKEHGHDPKGCRGIICWKHNWPDCPEGLEVIELSRVVKGK